MIMRPDNEALIPFVLDATARPEEQQARRNAFTAPMKSSNDPVNPLKKRTDRFSAHAA
jgi:hypothetical protein